MGSGCMFLHQGTNVLIGLMDNAIDESHLQNISNIEISAHSIVTILMKRAGV